MTGLLDGGDAGGDFGGEDGDIATMLADDSLLRNEAIPLSTNFYSL